MEERSKREEIKIARKHRKRKYIAASFVTSGFSALEHRDSYSRRVCADELSGLLFNDLTSKDHNEDEFIICLNR